MIDEMISILEKHPDTTDSYAMFKEYLIALRTSKTDVVIPWFYKLAKLFDGHDRTYLSALNIAVALIPSVGKPSRRLRKTLPRLERQDRLARLGTPAPKVIAKLGKKLATEVMTPLQTELALVLWLLPLASMAANHS